MKRNSVLRAKVLENCSSHKKQFQVLDSYRRQWAKITLDVLYDLMEGVSGLHKNKSKNVLVEMSEKKWRILSTAKEGGLGDANRPPDPVLHITISAKYSYHLRCKEASNGRLYIYEITS